MSTQPQLSPLELLGQDVQQKQQAPAQQPTPSQPQLSPLELLGQDVQKQQQQAPAPKKVATTERAMQQTMGGPPMFVDVPTGDKDQFEKAGQEGYQKGGVAGAGLVAAGGIAATAAPEIVEAATTVGKWAKANPLSTLALTKIADELGVHPFDMLHKAAKYGKGLIGD
jgi:hypothetical protein